MGERCERGDGRSRKEQNMGVDRIAKRKQVSWMQVGFTLKYKSDGSVERDKARLVVKWYSNLWIDYLETFAPVAKMNTV